MRPVLARALSFLAIVLGTGGCGGVIQATRDFSLSAPWESYERIVVRTRNGGVEVTSGDVPEIRIRGQKRVHGADHAEAEARLDDLEIVARRDESGPGTFLVELRVPDALAQCSPGASFTIQVPKPCSAEIHSSNGSIKVGQLKDHVVLGSSNGGITVKAVDGAVQARTSNGPIDVEAVRGDLTAETSNGRVTVRGVEGVCKIETSNGAVRLRDAHGNVQVRTSNASIDAEAAPPAEARVDLGTSNRAIELTLPKHMKGELLLKTSNGRVTSHLLGVPLELKQHDRHLLHAILNGGGSGEIHAETSNGPITFGVR